MGSLLIQFHEARIADDIRYDDRHELALNALLHHGRSSYATVNISRMVASWMGGPARRPVSVIRGRIGLSASCPVYPATATEEPTFRFGGFVPTGYLCTVANQLLYSIISSARCCT